MPSTRPLAPSAGAFLNALLREVSDWELVRAPLGDISLQAVSLPLTGKGARLLVPVQRLSSAGRHRFLEPLLLVETGAPPREIAFRRFAALVVGDAALVGQISPEARALFLARLDDSERRIRKVLEARRQDLDALFAAPLGFIEAEQGLLLGHPVHPTPKSYDEFSESDAGDFAPEFASAFPLRWFLVRRQHLEASGTADLPLEAALKRLVTSDPVLPPAARSELLGDSRRLPLPVHPWQAQRLLELPALRRLLATGELIDLGPRGSAYRPTSSLRTLYAEHSDFMLKFSISLRVTNSLRVLLPKEWERGKEVHRLLQSPLWREIARRLPSFKVMSEPVHLALRDPEGGPLLESAVILRRNPFRGEAAQDACVMATLCQDHPLGGRSRLAWHVRRIAAREDISAEAAGAAWFRRFCTVALRPLLILQADYGLLFGAHQQNTVLRLEQDYPAVLYYRDCQGTGYCDSRIAELTKALPGLGELAENTVEDALGHRLLGYYLIVNNVFNVIASLAHAGLGREPRLFEQLRRFLLDLREDGLRDPSFVDGLLRNPEIWSKGNFLTCLQNINENHRGGEQLAVYRPMANPIAARDAPALAPAPILADAG